MQHGSEASTITAVTALEPDVDFGTPPRAMLPYEVPHEAEAAQPPALNPFFWKTLQASIQVVFRVEQQLLNWDV